MVSEQEGEIEFLKLLLSSNIKFFPSVFILKDLEEERKQPEVQSEHNIYELVRQTNEVSNKVTGFGGLLVLFCFFLPQLLMPG